MDTTKIIVHTSPVAPFQQIYIIKNGELIDKAGITPNYLVDTIYAFVDKYEITHISFSGATSFAKLFAEELEKEQIAKYGMTKLTIDYI